MQELAKVALMQRIIDAWYRGDLDAVLAECTPTSSSTSPVRTFQASRTSIRAATVI
jgi:hypothetical protein